MLVAADLPSMTKPRRILPGDTRMSQKRCYRQEFRLRPDPTVNQIISYSLGYCADKYDIDLHEFSFLCNHDHVEDTDPFGNYPAFIQLFHSLVARAINAHFGEWEALWSSQRYSAPKLLEPEDMFRKSVYILMNPVRAGAVRYAWDWGGVHSYHMEYDRPLTVERPSVFFGKTMPERVELVIRRPKGLRPDLDDRELRREIRRQVKKEQGDFAKEFRAQGGTFLGMRRVMKQPRHHSPHDRGQRRGIRPTVVGLSKWARIEALCENKKFFAEHEEARQRFVDGQRDVEFPAGTYLMRVRFGVRCRPP
jgi:hypothetical protein